MSEATQENNSYDSAGIPLKRKRGRPRKDKSLYHVPSVRPRNHENLLRIENASVPEHVNSVEDTSSKVGHAVTGVVESVFDAGYVIAVKIGNSNITLRGIVFKPGHYAPVTKENDVAPCLPMIRGNKTRQATQNWSQARQRRPKERHQLRADYLGNGSSAYPLEANLLSRRDLCTAIVAAAPPVPLVGARGTVVPVVLEPGNAIAAQAARMATSKDKSLQSVTPLSPKLPAPHLSLSQTIFREMPKDANSGSGPCDHASLELHQQNADESMNSMNICLTAEEFHGASQPSKAEETSEMNETLYVEPLRTVHGNQHNQFPFIPNFVGHNGVGRMTELLQAVQENIKGSRNPETREEGQRY